MKFGQNSDIRSKFWKFGGQFSKLVKIHGLEWFVWFDLGLRALNFSTFTSIAYYEGKYRAPGAAKYIIYLMHMDTDTVY